MNAERKYLCYAEPRIVTREPPNPRNSAQYYEATQFVICRFALTIWPRAEDSVAESGSRATELAPTWQRKDQSHQSRAWRPRNRRSLAIPPQSRTVGCARSCAFWHGKPRGIIIEHQGRGTKRTGPEFGGTVA